MAAVSAISFIVKEKWSGLVCWLAGAPYVDAYDQSAEFQVRANAGQ